MKTTVTKSTFIDAFRALSTVMINSVTKRSLRSSTTWKRLEQDCGEELEFDVIALCCDYSVDTVEEIAANYSIEAEEGEDLRDAVLDYLNDNTTVIDADCDGSILYCSAF